MNFDYSMVLVLKTSQNGVRCFWAYNFLSLILHILDNLALCYQNLFSLVHRLALGLFDLTQDLALGLFGLQQFLDLSLFSLFQILSLGLFVLFRVFKVFLLCVGKVGPKRDSWPARSGSLVLESSSPGQYLSWVADPRILSLY